MAPALRSARRHLALRLLRHGVEGHDDPLLFRMQALRQSWHKGIQILADGGHFGLPVDVIDGKQLIKCGAIKLKSGQPEIVRGRQDALTC